MKNKFLIIFLLIVSISFGQDVKITKSEIFKDKKKHSFLSYALPDDNGGLVTIRSYRGGIFKTLKGYYIQHFDSKLNLIKELDYKFEGNYIRNAFVKDGKLNLIEYIHIKKEDRITMSAVTASLKDLKFTNKELLTFSEDNIKQYFGVVIFPFLIGNGFNQSDGDHLGEVILSKSKKYVVINFDFKNKEKESHKVFVFDTDFNKIYDKLIVKDVKDKYFSYKSIDIDDTDGTLYFLGKAYENNSRREKKKGKVNYHFELNKINKDGEQQVSFKTSDKYIGSMNLIFNGDKLTLVGFYGKKEALRYNGVCFFDINPETLTVENKKFNEFSAQFMSDKYGDKKRRKRKSKEKGINNIDFKGLEVLGNGDIVVNAEEFYITTSSYTSASGSFRTVTRYHFNDIMAMRMDKNGNLKWARNINKAQTYFENSSFTSISIGDSSYFFINCADKIKKNKDGRLFFKQATAKKSNLYMLKIDGNGDISYKKLVDDKDSKVYYKVNQGEVDMNNKEVILLGKRKRKTRILKIGL